MPSQHTRLVTLQYIMCWLCKGQWRWWVWGASGAHLSPFDLDWIMIYPTSPNHWIVGSMYIHSSTSPTTCGENSDLVFLMLLIILVLVHWLSKVKEQVFMASHRSLDFKLAKSDYNNLPLLLFILLWAQHPKIITFESPQDTYLGSQATWACKTIAH